MHTASSAVLALCLAFGCASQAVRGGVPSVPDRPLQAGPQRGPGSIQMISGEVIGIDRTTAKQQPYLLLRLQANSGGGPISVLLGPGWYLDKHGLHFEPNEHLSVQGTREVRDGKPLFVATEVTKGQRTLKLPKQD